MSEIHEIGGVWYIIYELMTFGGIFSEINLEISTLNIQWSFCMLATSKEMAKIVTKQQNDLIFGRRKTLCKSTITFNFRIVTLHFKGICYYLTNLIKS